MRQPRPSPSSPPSAAPGASYAAAAPASASNSAPAGAADTPTDGVWRGLTEAQLKVAHYATADGMVGLVLDRSGSKPKLRVDGQKEILELTVESEGVDQRVDNWLFRGPDGQVRVVLNARSGVYRWVTPASFEGLVLNSDAAAAPLPEATVRAAPARWELSDGSVADGSRLRGSSRRTKNV